MISVLLFKMGKHNDFHLSFFQIVGAWRDFTERGSFYKIRDVCMDFKPYFQVHNLISVHP